MKTLAVVLVALVLAGCASQRYLSDAEDAELRARCEPHGGCVAVPVPIWKQLEQLLQALSLRGT